MFGLPLESVERALDARGALAQSGLALILHGVLGPLDERFCLYRGPISQLFGHHQSAAGLLAALLPPKREGHLQLIDYSHLGEEIRLLRDYLGAAVAARRPCANVLLYGAPGCGKTELAAALAQSIDCHLYEVRAGGDNDCQMTPRERLVAVALSQKLVYGAGAAIVLVDEAEDLFPPAWSDPEKTPTKVVVNECIESNPAPTVWISNDTSHMDEAYLRRLT